MKKGWCLAQSCNPDVPEVPQKTILDGLMKTGGVGIKFQWIILIFCIFIIAIQVPALFSVFKKEKNVEYVPYTSDFKTNQCIDNLWYISKFLQQGELPDKDMVCPMTGESYLVTTTEDDVVVCCPNPEKHGFKKICISKKNPMPEVVK